MKHLFYYVKSKEVRYVHKKGFDIWELKQLICG